jgi:osmotically-inducible protein OsmY
MKGRVLAVAGLVVGYVAGAGCATTRPANSTADAKVMAASVKAKLTKEIRFANLTAVTVDPAKGRVTLSGKVATHADRADAGELASSVQGVVIVYNELEVRPAYR